MPERREVAPLVWLVQRVVVIGAVTRIHFCGTVASEEGFEGGVDERRVGDAGARHPSALQKICIHGRAQPCAAHATIMPRQGWAPTLLATIDEGKQDGLTSDERAELVELGAGRL